jgi:hypothetical protein
LTEWIDSQLKFLENAMRLLAEKHLSASWGPERVKAMHADIVTDFLKCETEPGVKAAVEYVKFLSHKGIDSDNVSFYLSLFRHPNAKVIQAFVGDGKILGVLPRLQRTYPLIRQCLDLLAYFTPHQVEERILVSLLSVIGLNYHNAEAGFRLCPLSLTDLNQIGKFLDKKRPQTNQLNRLILDILADIGDLKAKDTANRVVFDIAARANRIRNIFFDNRAALTSIIPQNLLK